MQPSRIKLAYGLYSITPWSYSFHAYIISFSSFTYDIRHRFVHLVSLTFPKMGKWVQDSLEGMTTHSLTP